MQPKELSTSATITRLDNTVINQIAAGEVVDRPASVIKELLENSLDAGATQIDLVLEDGGLKTIQIIDNGIGMNRADLALCLERHATSKIKTFSDLEAVESFGFRGEALASIAAVADVEVRSRTSADDSAAVIACSFGKTSPIKPAAGAVGTCITVKNLFHQLPARQKFLRSSATELSHGTKLLREIALGNPGVSFSLTHNGRSLAKYLGKNFSERFRECFKTDWTPVSLNEETEDMTLHALLSPSDILQDCGDLFIFINGRCIRNRNLYASVRQGYQEALGPHHDPSGAVYLDIRKDWVDVNVHPQKWEVRCLRQERLYQWLLSSVRKQISQAKAIREIRIPDTTTTVPTEDFGAIDVDLPKPAPYVPITFAATTKKEIREQTTLLMDQMKQASCRYLGQVKASYLVCEDPKGVLLVDQHALHEKLRYEELKDAFQKKTLQVQELLVPKIVRLPPELMVLVESNQEKFREMGLDIEVFGGGDIAVKSTPVLLSEEQIEEVVVETLRAIMEMKGEKSLEQILNPLFATMACHSVVRANETLSPVEATRLLDGLTDVEGGWTCPHGRPVLFRLSFHSIEKHFERT